jgi:transcriptional regulator with XRE-family HTH domain
MQKVDGLKAFADNLRWVKAHTDLDSQAKIGEASGVDQRTVGRWMNGSNAPTLESILGLAKRLKVEGWQLLAPGFGQGLFYVDGKMQIVPVPLPAQTKREIANAA